MQTHFIESTDSRAYTKEINAFLQKKGISVQHISHSTCSMQGMIYYSCLIVFTAK